MRRLLFISNGHGEIAIAERIAADLVAAGLQTPRGEPVVIDHLPLVGLGEDRGLFSLVGPRATMPSGGLVAMGNLRALRGDLAAGFARLLARQVACVRGAAYDATVAVGDAYALFFAELAGAPAIFVGTAKSVYVAPYGAGERRLLRRARRVFVRDAATAQHLTEHGVVAEAPGNTIVDLASDGPPVLDDEQSLRLAILPGSRERAYGDAVVLLEVVRALAAGRPVQAALSIAPSLTAERYAASLAAAGWTLGPATARAAFTASAGAARVLAWGGSLGAVFAGSDLALGQAGTANEQAAAAGIPVVALASRTRTRGGGEGWYRMRQQRLLGDALALVPPEPAAAAAAIGALLADASRLAVMRAAGPARLGAAGGTAAIAAAIRAEFCSDGLSLS